MRITESLFLNFAFAPFPFLRFSLLRRRRMASKSGPGVAEPEERVLLGAAPEL